MANWQLTWCGAAEDLSPAELDAVLRAQRDLIENRLGQLGLCSDLEFYFAKHLSGAVAGLLAVRPWDDGGKWVQIAWTSSAFRRQGVFSALVGRLMSANLGIEIGFGVRPQNHSMQAALAKLGITESTRYFETRCPSKFDKLLAAEKRSGAGASG